MLCHGMCRMHGIQHGLCRTDAREGVAAGAAQRDMRNAQRAEQHTYAYADV